MIFDSYVTTYQRVNPMNIQLNHYKIPLNRYKIPLNGDFPDVELPEGITSESSVAQDWCLRGDPAEYYLVARCRIQVR